MSVEPEYLKRFTLICIRRILYPGLAKKMHPDLTHLVYSPVNKISKVMWNEQEVTALGNSPCRTKARQNKISTTPRRLFGYPNFPALPS